MSKQEDEEEGDWEDDEDEDWEEDEEEEEEANQVERLGGRGRSRTGDGRPRLVLVEGMPMYKHVNEVEALTKALNIMKQSLKHTFIHSEVIPRTNFIFLIAK